MAAEDGDVGRPVRADERKEWQPTEALLLPVAKPPQPGRLTDTLKVVLGFFGRRAPASPA